MSAWFFLGTHTFGTVNQSERSLAALKLPCWRNHLGSLPGYRERCQRFPSPHLSGPLVFPAQGPDSWVMKPSGWPQAGPPSDYNLTRCLEPNLLAAGLLLLLLSRFNRVQLCATPWTAAYQASLSTGFSRQQYWSGLPFPSPRDCICCRHYIPGKFSQESVLKSSLSSWDGGSILSEEYWGPDHPYFSLLVLKRLLAEPPSNSFPLETMSDNDCCCFEP